MTKVQSNHFENNYLPGLNRAPSAKRIEELATPKENKKIWVTSFGPKLFWGYEDMMWPVTKAALHARPNKRLLELAASKKNHQLGTERVNKSDFEYSCGRASQIWDVKHHTMKPAASEKILRLSTPKQPPTEFIENRKHSPYGCGRVSAIWNVSLGAMQCGSRPRTTDLAKSKPPHKDYEPNREVETEINPTALKCVTSARIEELSRPKTRDGGPFIDSRSPAEAVWKVNGPARSASASPRILELAKFKTIPEGFVPNRGVQWPVSRSAKRAVATPRHGELAKPKIRDSMDHLQFNPDAFLVSPRAMKSRCTPRIEELAQPIQR